MNRIDRAPARLLLFCFLAIASCREAGPSIDGGATRHTAEEGPSDSQEPLIAPPRVRTTAERLGTHFTDSSERFQALPEFTAIELPDPPLKNSIWGATGRDDSGAVYFGISCDGPGIPSAVLCRLTPGSQQAVSLGDAVANLNRLGLSPADDASQMKIHAKPVQAQDGKLYFASMDEKGERDDGSQLPIHGSHLWRVSPSADPIATDEPPPWEHVFAAPEGLIALGGTGRYIYAMGYYQHVVYQFDVLTNEVRRTEVGSVGGHVSRNFLVDLNEHAYVPRVQENDAGELVSWLVELDEQLREVVAHPLDDYGPSRNFDSHGIVGFAAMRQGDYYFVTADGALYHLIPQLDAPSRCERRGWIHPREGSYTAFLCSPDGVDHLCGITRQGNQPYQWLVYDLNTNSAQTIDLSPQAAELIGRPRSLVYGSNTQDDQGDAFAAGWFLEQTSGGFRPWAVRVHWPETTALPVENLPSPVR